MTLLYIGLGLAGLLAVLAVGAMVFFKLTIGRRDSWKKPEEHVVGGGEKKALFLYQPSNGKRNVPQAEQMADVLAALGYTVTVNYPSQQVGYDPAEYDLLVFGTPVYLGESAKPVREYLQAHPVAGKTVLLWACGRAGDAPELEAMKLLLPDDNRVLAVKAGPEETEKLLAFVKEHAA